MNQKSTDEYISPEDRERLISELHRFLTWVKIISRRRAIMDLKECESGRVQLKGSSEDIKKKIDAKRWLSFLKSGG